MRWLSLLVLLPACWWGDNTVIPFDALVEGDPPTTTASPAPGVYRDGVADVTLTSDEDANIYYTLDGSTPTIGSEHGPSPLVIGALDASTEVRYFGLDRDGDREPEHATAYLIDRLGPPPVAGMTTTFAGFGLDVRWTAPDEPGLVDVVVAETADVAATIPTFGATVSVGDAIGAGTVVFVGAGDHVTFDTPVLGSHTFLAWARYDTGTYSEARVISVYIDGAAERAHLTLDTGAVTGSVTIQPAHATVAVANVAFNAGTLTFDVTTTSGFVGLAYNPMLVASMVTGGTLVGDGTITLDADYPYVDLGPEAWADGAAVTRTITITGASGTVALDLDVRHTAGAYVAKCTCALGDPGGYLVDRAAGTARAGLPRSPNAFDGEGYEDVLVAPDGRHVLAGTILPSVISIDPTDGTIADTFAPGGAGEIAGLRMDPSGQRLYALLEEGTFTDLIELDPATLDERGRVTLPDSAGTAPALDLSRDGRWAAVLANAQVYVIDLSAFAMRDADPTIAGAQPIVPPTGWIPTAVAFDATSARLAVNSGLADLTADQLGVLDLTEAVLAFRVFDLDDDPDTATARFDGLVAIAGGQGGYFLLGDLPGLVRFNGATNAFNPSGADAHTSRAGRIDRDGNLEILSDVDLGTYAATGAYTLTATLPAATCDRAIAVTPF